MELCRWCRRVQQFAFCMLWLGTFTAEKSTLSASAFLPSPGFINRKALQLNRRESTTDKSPFSASALLPSPSSITPRELLLGRKTATTTTPLQTNRKGPLLYSTIPTESATTAAAATSSLNEAVVPHHVTRQFAFELSKPTPTPSSRWRRIFGRKKIGSEVQRLDFSYDSNILELSATTRSTHNATTHHHRNIIEEVLHAFKPTASTEIVHPMFESGIGKWCYDHLKALELSAKNFTTPEEAPAKATTGVILIHPIGVGIGKWYYNRLLESLYNLEGASSNTSSGNQAKTHELLVVAPDLLGSGTACNPINSKLGEEQLQLPLLNVTDWAAQISRLMANLEKEYPNIETWCLVTNGGCSPIALQVAEQSIRSQDFSAEIKLNGATNAATEVASPFESHCFQRPVTNVILSSAPRLPFFLPLNNGREARLEKQRKLQKSYRQLCGLAGRLFWWYALRNQGAFIQKFSERNLVGDSDNLGESWTPNCVAMARMHNGKSKYSTFSFLAGSLQAEGCRESLEALRGSGVSVDIIQGRDNRRNKAKSVFWQKYKKTKKKRQEETSPSPPQETLQHFLKRNGNRGEVLQVGGRISLAHEDAPGYAKALLDLLDLQSNPPS